MKTRFFFALLGFSYLLSLVESKCDLSNKKADSVDFPDIMKYVAESYIMGVEYTASGAKQTDYYTEYYDNAFQRGRLETHIEKENKIYIYRSQTWEAWNLEGRKCKLVNITVTPDFMKDDMTDWRHFTGKMNPTTVGPSAMFKIAYDAWKKIGKKTMVYMGKADKPIRGESAVFWRRCIENDGYVDYYFAGQNEENPFDTDAFGKVITPLRVEFRDISGQEEGLKNQFYDIISFQHLIPAGVEPFELPKGRMCERGELVDAPQLPDFSSSNVLLYAEVVYQKYSTENDGYDLMSSYYSTLMFALDRDINHLAYYYSSWNTTKPDKDHEEPFVNAPFYVIYDLFHTYKYSINFETATCEISRTKTFSPQYKLPENGGSLDLNNPLILFPNNELKFLSKGTNRGLGVNIFEAEMQNFLMNSDTLIPRVIATHSFMKKNERLENTVEVTGAPTQIQLQMFRKDNIEEVLTFNIFGFSTRIPRQYIFDVQQCFKNDDDYSYLTIGFEVPSTILPQLPKKFPEIEGNVMTDITRRSELNAVRIPKIMSDIKDNYLYVTLLILGTPPLALEFNPPEAGKSIKVKNEATDTLVSSFDDCARNCLETQNGCWAFAMCGSTCYFGTTENTNVEAKSDCSLYTRYNNNTYIQSKEKQINNIVALVKSPQFNTMVTLDSGERITLEAVIAQVTDPAEDDSLFEKMGNQVNPRMRVVKAGYKLKNLPEVKHMGKLRFDECQSLCLDFKDCETVSYCLISGKCILSTKYGNDLTEGDMERDYLCNLVTREYTDHFERTPGVFVKVSGGVQREAKNEEECAKACLKESTFKCLSFDHCNSEKGCTLYPTHYLSPQERKAVADKDIMCGHYSRKFSNEFRRTDETRLIGSKISPLMNLTLEQCAKSCVEYGQGTCYGYDFCQDSLLYATTCVLFDTDPSRLKSTYSPVCTNYVRSGQAYTPRPFTNSYAGGIGFLCFLIGGIVGGIVVFAIAYYRVNRG